MAKKIPESKEDAAARRQRELALLTSGVAAFSLMGETPPPAPAPVQTSAPAPVPAAPAATAPVAITAEVATPAPQPIPEPEGKKAAAQPTAATSGKATATPTATPVKRVGEEPVGPAKTASAPVTVETEPEADDDAELGEPDAEVPATTETGGLDLSQLFVPSSEKKGTTLRITADHQQFFTNLGFLLGNGASAPDIIHNILTRFRAEHEAPIQKALKKQMRQLLYPKK